MKVRAAFVLTAALLIAADEPGKEAGKADLVGLQGTWQAVSAEIDGEKKPAAEIKFFKLVVAGNKLTAPGNRVSSFELDATKNPRIIAMTPQDGPHKGKLQRGIYALDKDTLKLCVNNQKQEPAKEFATKKGDGFALFLLKREPVKPKAEK